MPSPFSIKPLEKQSFFGRLLGHAPKKNAFINLNNALSEAKNIAEIDEQFIANLDQKFKTNIRSKFQAELAELYRKALLAFSADNHLDDSEYNQLNYLQKLFRMNPVAIESIHAETIGKVYEKAVRNALADNHLSASERQYLDTLRNGLRLSEKSATTIFSEAAIAILNSMAKTAIRDSRVTPEEEETLHRLAGELGVNLTFEPETRKVWSLMKRHWQLENGPLPDIQVEFNLQKSEQCVFHENAALHEMRRVTERVRYGGPSVRIRIMKGVYYRAGGYSYSSVSRDVLKPIDNGVMYVTTKRIVFMGHTKNVTVRHSNLLGFTPYSDGIEIEKTSGKNPFFLFDRRLDECGILLNRVLAHAD